MKLFIYPNPNLGTLAEKRQSEVSPGQGWLEMTEEEFAAWAQQQIAEGWAPQAQPKTPEELAAEARKVWPSSADFWAAFTDSEKLAILASTIAGIILLREELRLWTGEVWSDDAKVQAGLTGLVAVGILTNDRKSAILAP